MSFKADKVGLHVSSTGKGGFITYYTDDDGVASVNTAYFNLDESDLQTTGTNPATHFTRTDLAMLRAMEEFIREQSDNPQDATQVNAGGVMFFAIGNNAATAGGRYRARLVYNNRSTAAERKAFGRIAIVAV